MFSFLLGNPNCGAEQGGSTRKYDAYAHHVQCSAGGCQVVEIRRLFMPVDYRIDPGIPGQKGVITAFCFQNGEERCPDWVDQSINLRSEQGQSPQRTGLLMSYQPLALHQNYRIEELAKMVNLAVSSPAS